MAETEIINGHHVLPAYVEYWREHPEIGMPVSEPQPDGSQWFERAVLWWDDAAVAVSHRPLPPPDYGVPTI